MCIRRNTADKVSSTCVLSISSPTSSELVRVCQELKSKSSGEPLPLFRPSPFFTGKHQRIRITGIPRWSCRGTCLPTFSALLSRFSVRHCRANFFEMGVYRSSNRLRELYWDCISDQSSKLLKTDHVLFTCESVPLGKRL